MSSEWSKPLTGVANKATTAPSMQLYGEGKLQGVSSDPLYKAERPNSQAFDGTWVSIPQSPRCRPSSAFQHARKTGARREPRARFGSSSAGFTSLVGLLHAGIRKQ